MPKSKSTKSNTKGRTRLNDKSIKSEFSKCFILYKVLLNFIAIIRLYILENESCIIAE